MIRSFQIEKDQTVYAERGRAFGGKYHPEICRRKLQRLRRGEDRGGEYGPVLSRYERLRARRGRRHVRGQSGVRAAYRGEARASRKARSRERRLQKMSFMLL